MEVINRQKASSTKKQAKPVLFSRDDEADASFLIKQQPKAELMG
jgi:hypothetical protein